MTTKETARELVHQRGQGSSSLVFCPRAGPWQPLSPPLPVSRHSLHFICAPFSLLSRLLFSSFISLIAFLDHLSPLPLACLSASTPSLFLHLVSNNPLPSSRQAS